MLVVAANLRPAITAVGPVLHLIGTDTDLSSAWLGLLGAVPLLTFAAVSPAVHLLSQRFGTDRAVLASLVVLVAGTVLRDVPGFTGWLWLGTAVLSGAVAVGNVLVPSIVKRDFPRDVPLMTGLYSAVLSGFAALASGLAVPLADVGGWRLALGVWAALSAVAAAVWALRLVGPDAPVPAMTTATPSPQASMWRSPVAWQVALFMGSQSLTFYLLITWLPTIERSHGVEEVVAGWHLFGYQMCGIVGSLAVGWAMRRTLGPRSLGVVVSVLMVAAMGGLLAAPGLVLLWDALAGLSSGAALVLSLTLIAVRARSTRDAGRLSGMVQSIGYLIAAGGPLGAGALNQLTSSWSPVVIAVAAVATIQCGLVLAAGRDRFTHP